jgi:ketosteroid isomerase-like protein
MAENSKLATEVKDLQKRVKLLEDKESIRDVISTYVHNLDAEKQEAAVKVWSDECVFVSDIEGSVKHYKGQQGMLDFFKASAQRNPPGHQHFQMDYIISVDGDTAKAVGYQLMILPYSGKFSIDRAGFRFFTFKRTGGKWLIFEAISHVVTDTEGCRKILSKM